VNATTRLAIESDLAFVDAADRHLSPVDIAHLISAGRVMVAEVEGDLCALLRWGLFWDEIPFMNLLWVLPDRRGHGIGTALIHAWENVHRAAGHQLVLTSTSSS
jgi:GNAT superfamily N-acetyltransferase